MSDLIKRSDAVEMVEIVPFEDYGDYQTVREAIMRLPTADRPREIGHWKNYKDEHCCSVCREVVIDDWYSDDDWYNFCPNCGADMRGADDE